MKKLTPEIVERLNAECGSEIINFVGLGAHNLQISFRNDVCIQSEEAAKFPIKRKENYWTDLPIDAPFGLLVDQTVEKFTMENPFTLRMKLRSGDFVDFETRENQFVSLTIWWNGSHSGLGADAF